jgi:hypothetical protein
MTRTITTRPWDGTGDIPDFYIDARGKKQVYRMRDMSDDTDPGWRERLSTRVFNAAMKNEHFVKRLE